MTSSQKDACDNEVKGKTVQLGKKRKIGEVRRGKWGGGGRNNRKNEKEKKKRNKKGRQIKKRKKEKEKWMKGNRKKRGDERTKIEVAKRTERNTEGEREGKGK